MEQNLFNCINDLDTLTYELEAIDHLAFCLYYTHDMGHTKATPEDYRRSVNYLFDRYSEKTKELSGLSLDFSNVQ